MCGIVGIIAKNASGFTYKHRQMFEQMLMVDVLRGEDSTGLYQVNKHGNVRWCKEASTPLAMLEDSEAKGFMSDVVFSANIVVGHNRKATKGKVNDENAHPFIENNIILVHNGTLTNHKDLNNDVEVDSHAIAHAISEHGIIPAIQKLKGAYAVAAYDANQRKFFLFRNKERPLWVGENKDAYFFASEPWMLFGMAWRNEITFDEKVEMVKENTLYTFDQAHNNAKTVQEVPEVKPFLPAIVQFPEKQEKKGGKVGQPSRSFHTNFLEGNYIVFKPETCEVSSMGKYIYGQHYADSNVRVRCRVETGNIHILKKEPLLCAEVRSVSNIHSTGGKLVFAAGPERSYTLETVNGTELNEEQVQQLTGECSTCGSTISEEEIEDSFVKITPNRLIHICPTCVEANLEKNPMWGGIIKHEVQTSVIH